MIHEYCETCEGWATYPASQDSHNCETDEVSNPDPNYVFLVMNADWSSDSDY